MLIIITYSLAQSYRVNVVRISYDSNTVKSSFCDVYVFICLILSSFLRFPNSSWYLYNLPPKESAWLMLYHSFIIIRYRFVQSDHIKRLSLQFHRIRQDRIGQNLDIVFFRNFRHFPNLRQYFLIIYLLFYSKKEVGLKAIKELNRKVEGQ